jgi:large subunit ribosomal protein L13
LSYINKYKIVDTLSYRTVSGNKETANKKWLVVDAEGQTVGRLASKVAKIIRGKHKTNFTPHADCGDNVIVINAEKIAFSGTKLINKEYVRYTGYPGGQRFTSAQDMLRKHPERLIEKAVKGMLPKNKLGRNLFTNLKVYVGPSHNQEAQKPEAFNLDSFK